MPTWSKRSRQGCRPSRPIAANCSSSSYMRKLALVLLVSVTPAATADAQSPYEPFSLTTTVAIDAFGGDNISSRPQIIVDIVGTARLGNGWQAFIRPWFRQARPAA